MAALHNGQSVVVCARNTLRCVTKVVQVVPLDMLSAAGCSRVNLYDKVSAVSCFHAVVKRIDYTLITTLVSIRINGWFITLSGKSLATQRQPQHILCSTICVVI